MRSTSRIRADAALLRAVQKIHRFDLREKLVEMFSRHLRSSSADHRDVRLTVVDDRAVEIDGHRIDRTGVRWAPAASHLNQGVWHARQLFSPLTGSGGFVVPTTGRGAHHHRYRHHHQSHLPRRHRHLRGKVVTIRSRAPLIAHTPKWLNRGCGLHWPSLRQAAPSSCATTPSVLLRRSMTTVMLVEDEDDTREILAAALEDAGYEILQADNGATPVEIPELLQNIRRYSS